MTTQTIYVAIFALLLASCQRSNRSVEVQPVNNGGLPSGTSGGGDGSSGGGGGGGDGVPQNDGRINLTVNAPGVNGTAMVNWSFNGSSDSVSMTLTNGSGSTVLSNVATGSSTLTVDATINGMSYQGSSSASVNSFTPQTVTVTLSLQNTTTGGSVNPPTGGVIPQTSAGGNGNNTTAGSGGDTNVIINPSIGGGMSVQPNNLWNGLNLQGNSKWTIEAIN